ncbi:protein translocase SEC61 complex subunit gamma [Candidatus Woesearchaeota archaeon]|nr:protein translocase SEC61 complex subunit gamma [Candidatus Woesearchaeota archaeon]
MDEQQEKKTLTGKIKTFLIECKRVFQVTKKPTKDELKTIVKVSGIGMLIIGAIGFLVHLIWTLVS